MSVFEFCVLCVSGVISENAGSAPTLLLQTGACSFHQRNPGQVHSDGLVWLLGEQNSLLFFMDGLISSQGSGSAQGQSSTFRHMSFSKLLVDPNVNSLNLTRLFTCILNLTNLSEVMQKYISIISRFLRTSTFTYFQLLQVNKRIFLT